MLFDNHVLFDDYTGVVLEGDEGKEYNIEVKRLLFLKITVY